MHTDADKPPKQNRLFHWFSSPWVGLAGTLFSVLGVGLAVYFYVRAEKDRELFYYIYPAKAAVVTTGQASGLRVLHGDKEITTDVTAIQVAIWNEGKEPIKRDNILSQIVFVTVPPTPILEVRIRKSTRALTDMSIDTSRLSQGEVPITWKILEHLDGGVLQIIYAGPFDTRISLEGAIEGQGKPRSVASSMMENPSTEDRMKFETKLYWMNWVTVTLAIIATIYICIRWLPYAKKSRNRTVRVTMFGFGSFVVIVSLVFISLSVYKLLAPSGPPFGP